MTGETISLIVSIASIVATLVLVGVYFQAKITEANAETDYWRRKAEQLDKPGAQ